MKVLLFAGRFDILESSEDLFNAAVDAVLVGRFIVRRGSPSVLQRFAFVFEQISLGLPSTDEALDTETSLVKYAGEALADRRDITLPRFTGAGRCARLVQVFAGEAERPIGVWLNSIGPWERIVQEGIREFGERRKFVELANLAAGIPSKEEKCQDSPDLFDVTRPMVRRARYARLKAGNRRWWLRQLELANGVEEVRMALLLFSTWAGRRTIEELAESLDKLVVDLRTSDWQRLRSSLRMAVEVSFARPWIKSLRIRVDVLPSSLSARTVALLAERTTMSTAEELYERYLTDYNGNDSIILSLRAAVKVRRALGDETQWPLAIEALRASYKLGAPA